RVASLITKTTAAFAPGSAAGGLDTGAIANNTWYYVYVIKNADDGTVDILFSTSATAPSMPAGFTLKRIIAAIKTNGSAQFIQWFMYADGTQAWKAGFTDVSDSTL